MPVTMDSSKPNYHNDYKYNNNSINKIERLLIEIYSQRTFNGKYRKFNCLQNELNIPDTVLTGNTPVDAQNISNSIKRLHKCVSRYINLQGIRDWDGVNGICAGALVHYEHTIHPSYQSNNWDYHPHVHIYLIIYDAYNAPKSRISHSPNFQQLHDIWYKILLSLDWNSSAYDIHNSELPYRDMFQLVPGYVVTNNSNDFIYQFRKGKMMRKTGSYNHGSHLLRTNDDINDVRKMAYGEAKEFSKYSSREHDYFKELDNHNFISYKNQFKDKYLLPIWLNLNNNKLGRFEIFSPMLKKLWNEGLDGDFDDIPIINYSPRFHQNMLFNSNKSLDISNQYESYKKLFN